MTQKAFQDYYPDELSHCYGCGRHNEHGLQIKSYWDGEESVAHYLPKDYHIAVPGYVYGGLLASLIDCHGTGTAAAAIYKMQNRPMDDENDPVRYMTKSLFVKYLRPTPLHEQLTLRGQVKNIDGPRVTVEVKVIAQGQVTVQGEVVASRVPQKIISRMIQNK